MRFANDVKTAFLLGTLIAFAMGLGYLVAGPTGLIIGLVMGGLGNVIAFFNSDKLAVMAMRGQEVSRDEIPWLHDMVARLADRAGLPMPRIYVCPQAAPNAFATGRSPKHAAVAITEGMLRNFPAEEIEGVMAHELAHIKHRDVLTSTIASIFAGMISMLGYFVFFFGGHRDSPIGMVGTLLMILLAPIGAALIQMAISRQREFAADSYAAELAPARYLSNALRRLEAGNSRIPTDTPPAFHNMYICEPLSSGGIGSLFSTHPPIDARIAALEKLARDRF